MENHKLAAQTVARFPHTPDGGLIIPAFIDHNMEAIVEHILNARDYGVLRTQSNDTWDVYNAAIAGEVHLVEINQRYLISTVMSNVIYPMLFTLETKFPWHNFTP